MIGIIIAGSRDFNDYDLLKSTLDLYNFDPQKHEIVSGCAQGADSLGEKYAKERGLQVKRFPADWQQHGKAAGPIRNEKMAQYAKGLIAFWDGESRGTKNMIGLAEKYGLKVKIVIYRKQN